MPCRAQWQQPQGQQAVPPLALPAASAASGTGHSGCLLNKAPMNCAYPHAPDQQLAGYSTGYDDGQVSTRKAAEYQGRGIVKRKTWGGQQLEGEGSDGRCAKEGADVEGTTRGDAQVADDGNLDGWGARISIL